jgi:acyl carrier protein
MPNIELVVQEHCRELLGGALPSGDGFDMRRRLVEEYGFSSLQLVTLLTTVCEQSGVPLTALTERDIETIKTAEDIVGLVRRAHATRGDA